MGWEWGLILPGLMADLEEVILMTTIEIKKIIIKASISAKKSRPVLHKYHGCERQRKVVELFQIKRT